MSVYDLIVVLRNFRKRSCLYSGTWALYWSIPPIVFENQTAGFIYCFSRFSYLYNIKIRIIAFLHVSLLAPSSLFHIYILYHHMHHSWPVKREIEELYNLPKHVNAACVLWTHGFIYLSPPLPPYFRVIEQLGGKQLVMNHMHHEDQLVRYNALLCVQKLMVHNWYDRFYLTLH